MTTHSDSGLLAQEILDYLCPYLVQAGRYALRIQKGITKQPDKTGMTNAFAAALTDADLSIQTFVEVVLLSRFPQLSFFGEEYAQSFNMKYFPKDSELTLYLDPVDGTLFFQDGLDNFNIIATLADRQRIVAAACYVPAHDKLFSAVIGSRTVVRSSGQVEEKGPGIPLELSKNPPVVVTYRNREEAATLAAEFDIFCIADRYVHGSPCLAPNSLLLQQAGVIFAEEAGLIDWGAIAFLVQQAGGKASDWHGKPLPAIGELAGLCFPAVVACRDAVQHERILELLRLPRQISKTRR